jgi:DNA-binding CsgD family transcriptional regulator
MDAGEPMSARFQALTEKEKQTLRLIVRGHDAKSMARHLGLSVHTVNERLRDARRKLEVSSSREAARLLLDAEREDPQNLADKQIGEAGPSVNMEQGAVPGFGRARTQRPTALIAGVILMSLILGVLALSLISDGSAPPTAINPASSETTASLAARESEVVRSARAWLELGDQGRWKDGWLATATSFRTANTAERWAGVQEQVRVPLGAVISRTALSQESVPAPPAGVEVVKFRTSFANKADVIETVSLAREGSDWRVVGIYLD